MPRAATIAFPTPNSAITLDQVDPALNPNSITLSLTGMLFSSASVENLEASAADFVSTDLGVVTLERPNGAALLTAQPITSLGGRLGAYDGKIDAAGTSGAIFQSNGSSTASVKYGPTPTTDPDAALLLGTGTVTFPAAASARIQAIAPGNFNAEFASSLAATASVDATYGTAPTSLGPTGSIIEVDGQVVPPNPSFNNIQARQQTITIGQAATGTDNTVAIAGFDPALGTLVGVDIDLLAYASGTAALENLDPVAGIVAVSQAASIALTRIDGTALVSAAAPTLSMSTILAGSDGRMDFAGPASTAQTLTPTPAGNRTALTLTPGYQGSIVANHGTGDTLFTDQATLAAFTASGSITLDANRVGVTAISGPGNLDISASLQTGGAAIVTYLYAP